MLRWIVTLLLATVLGSSLASASAARALAPRVPEWATKFLSAWYYSYNRGDATGVAALFSENARLAATEGRAAIQKTLAAEFEKTPRRCKGDDLRFCAILRWVGVMKHASQHEMVEKLIERRSNGYLYLK